jgi:hypothetical protein
VAKQIFFTPYLFATKVPNSLIKNGRLLQQNRYVYKKCKVVKQQLICYRLNYNKNHLLFYQKSQTITTNKQIIWLLEINKSNKNGDSLQQLLTSNPTQLLVVYNNSWSERLRASIANYTISNKAHWLFITC